MAHCPPRAGAGRDNGVRADVWATDTLAAVEAAALIARPNPEGYLFRPSPAEAMSSPIPFEATPPATTDSEDAPAIDGWRSGPANGLAALRAELDTIDDAMHDLLMRRARVVEAVAQAGKRSALRPGREASIIRRLLARHQGSLPPQALYRMWRELLAATTSMQGGFALAVYDPDPGADYTQLAREQYGALTPLRAHHSASQAIADLASGAASIAILPLPSETEGWWTTLLHPDIHVVARLPFWTPRPEGSPAVQAFVVAPFPPDASGQDRSLLGLELDEDVSRARLNSALAAAGFSPGMVLLRRDRGARVVHGLVEVNGHVGADDARLQAVAAMRPPLVLGGYAVPVGGVA
ncbi:MAG TPA: chorismate mutase [Acetobacteraceae bacterium]|nr:chorismate mutase [Acetobacteraceae bacterium]